jgi:hypothetical protein
MMRSTNSEGGEGGSASEREGMMDSASGFSVPHFFSQNLRNWRVTFGLMLVGSLVGLVLSLFKPPIYQAYAVLGVNIQYGVTEPMNLVVEDRALNRVAALIGSDRTIAQTLKKIPENVIRDRGWTDVEVFREALLLERRLAEWWLAAFDQDPQVALAVAEAWITTTIRVLNNAAEHAWKAAALMGDPFNIECEKVKEFRVPAYWDCQVEAFDLGPEALEGEIQTEIALSRGMLPNISYELLSEASLPSNPILRDRGLFILSGALAGLILGVILSRDGIFPYIRRQAENSG